MQTLFWGIRFLGFCCFSFQAFRLKAQHTRYLVYLVELPVIIHVGEEGRIIVIVYAPVNVYRRRKVERFALVVKIQVGITKMKFVIPIPGVIVKLSAILSRHV